MLFTAIVALFAPLAPLTAAACTVPCEGVELHPNGDARFCLDVKDGALVDKAPVQIYRCNNTPAQRWVLTRGTAGEVRLAGTNLCLEADQDPVQANIHSGLKIRIGTCRGNRWTYTDDDTLFTMPRSTHGHLPPQCLDVTDGVMADWTRAQMWQCYAGNENQIWVSSLPKTYEHYEC